MHRHIRVQFDMDEDKMDSKSGTLTITYSASEMTDVNGNHRNAENWRFSKRVDLGDQKDRKKFFTDCGADFKAYIARRKVERTIEAELTARMRQILEADDPAPETQAEALTKELHSIDLKVAKGEITEEQGLVDKEAAFELYGAPDQQKRQLAIQKARAHAEASKAVEPK